MHDLRRIAQRSTTLGREEGQALIMVALLMTAMLGFLGLVLDFGQGTMRHRQTQNAADAAAQGAATQIWLGSTIPTATSTAIQLLPLHGYSSTNLTTIQYLDANNNITTTASSVRYVHTVVTETFRTFLLGIVGIPTATVNAQATVKIDQGVGACAFCALGPGGVDLSVKGNGNVTVSGGGLVVDSSDPTSAIDLKGGNATVTAPFVGAVGGVSDPHGGVSNGSPGNPATTGIAPVPDPLGYLRDPFSSGLCGINQSASSGSTLPPGLYNDLQPNGGGTASLAAGGIYCITGAVGKQSTITAPGGALLYFLCGTAATPHACGSSGELGGCFTQAGNGSYTGSGPTSGQYKGIAIFYDRNNTCAITLHGNGAISALDGTIYGKSAHVNFTGNASLTQNSMLVVDSAGFVGNGNVTINYTSDKNARIRPPVFTM